MDHHDEADENADRAPPQVGGPEPQDHTLLTIDGAGCLLESWPVCFSSAATLILLPYLAGRPLGRGRFGGGDVAGKKATLLLLTRVTKWLPWASNPCTTLRDAY